MINYIEVSDIEFVKKMYDEKALCVYSNWRLEQIYENFKKSGFLKDDNFNIYVINGSLIAQEYDYLTRKDSTWYVILPSELNINLDDDDIYVKITLDSNYGCFQVFNEMVDDYNNRDNPEYQKQSFIKFYKRIDKTPEAWAEKAISAHSFHGPIDPEKVERIRSCKTWDDVYEVYNEIVQYLPR